MLAVPAADHLPEERPHGRVDARPGRALRAAPRLPSVCAEQLLGSERPGRNRGPPHEVPGPEHPLLRQASSMPDLAVQTLENGIHA